MGEKDGDGTRTSEKRGSEAGSGEKEDAHPTTHDNAPEDADEGEVGAERGEKDDGEKACKAEGLKGKKKTREETTAYRSR
jgi:hypothetical protein